jgi:peptide/nickel transport system substrate-binding protein
MLAALMIAGTTGCLHRPVNDPGIIVSSLAAGPNNLDPRMGTDDSSQKIDQLIFDSLMGLDEHLRVVPSLAESLDHPDPLTYVAHLRHGVRFHDGRSLTADDVVFTFAQFLDPASVSPRKGGYRELKSVGAEDAYTVVFVLNQPFASFPINLIMPIVEKGAGADLRDHPVGSGPYRFVRYDVDDQVELAANADYWGGAPRNRGLILKIVPDDVMRGLELRKGTMDVVVNDLAPDIVFQMRDDPSLNIVEAPGVDYMYVGLNTTDPRLTDVRVRQALAYAIDRDAIVEYLRRGLAVAATGMLSPLSWAAAPGLPEYRHDPAKAKALLDEAGYADPDGDGPLPRMSLVLKVSNSEFNRLQSTVIQQNLREVGIDVDVRTYEFATLYADVLSGNFQMYTLQWTAGALADPDILRRVFHSRQVPPVGFNRGRYANPEVDALLDQAEAAADEAVRLNLYAEVQQIVAHDVPYVSLWYKTNVAITQRGLAGVRLNPLGDLSFFKDVSRIAAPTN